MDTNRDQQNPRTSSPLKRVLYAGAIASAVGDIVELANRIAQAAEGMAAAALTFVKLLETAAAAAERTVTSVASILECAASAAEHAPAILDALQPLLL